MDSKIQIPDLIILVPGILGSVLQCEGEDIWGISLKAIMTGVVDKFNGKFLEKLKLKNDDYNIDDLEDGITATRLITVPRLISGLTKTDGYTDIAQRINQKFDTKYFEFPYDWRRDNRASAAKLKKFIEARLKECAPEAKVILIAHSMGGLVSRYYLEVLQGWQNCKALITLGTPFRGSVNALNYLVNGYKNNRFADVTDLARSFTSVYQLLPIYEMLKVGGEYQLVTKTNDIPDLDITKAQNALKFHDEIKSAQKKNAKEENYRSSILACVGKEQETYQSARLSGKNLIPDLELPPNINPNLFGGGDGTVPRRAAIPIEWENPSTSNSSQKRDIFNVPETHSSLQRNNSLFDSLIGYIEGLYQLNPPPIRGDSSQTAISVKLEDLYIKGQEPFIIKAQFKGNFPTDTKDKLKLKACIERVDNSSEASRFPFKREGDEWSLNIDTLEPGLYRLTVETPPFQTGGIYPTAVHDIFEVI